MPAGDASRQVRRRVVRDQASLVDDQALSHVAAWDGEGQVLDRGAIGVEPGQPLDFDQKPAEL